MKNILHNKIIKRLSEEKILFKQWLNDNFEKSLFGRYEYKDNPNRGNWSKNELKDKFNKLNYD